MVFYSLLICLSEKGAVVRGVISVGRERKGNEGENEGDGLVG